MAPVAAFQVSGQPLRPFLCLMLLAFGSFESFMIANERRPVAQLIAAPDSGWPQFRGPRRDCISDERGLLQSWPDGGPKQLWSVAGLGRGFSSPIISNGRLFITGDHEGELQRFAFDLEGRELWRTKNGLAWSRDYPGARFEIAWSSYS